MILLLAAGPERAVFTTGVPDLDQFAAAATDRYARLGEALFSLGAYDAVRDNLRRHGAPDLGITTDFRFVLALLGHPTRLRSVTAIRKRGLLPAVVALAAAEDVTFLPLEPAAAALH